MKRTNLVLDAQMLEEARKILSTKTYSETVNKALDEAIRIAKIRRIPDLLGKVEWHGDLSETREDHPRKIKRKKKAA